MDATQEVKSRLDIADIVQEYIPMKPAGAGSFKGLCPFHKENSPSFFANRPRQSWHCFGCDEGGDVIDFVQRMEGMEFREALELLASKAGVTLPTYAPQDRSQKQRLFEINAMAARWFRNQLLKNPLADHARSYAEQRGIDLLTGDLWQIGFAPADWDALLIALKNEGADEKELILAGLASPRQSGSGVYSRFRDRLMFTIMNRHGNIVGFTGRLLSEHAKEAKYVNTPETPVYKKGEILYGLEKAKGDIKRHDLAVIVEGNMDAITSHRHDVSNVVASSGTALTESQLGLLKRYTTNLAFAFDTDAGGTAAAKRGVDLARRVGFTIRMVLLPEGAGKDPDDIIRKDVALWKEAIAQAPEYTTWLYRLAFRQFGGHDPQSKKEIAKTLLPEFAEIQDPIERDGWIVRLSEDLGVSPTAIRDSLKKVPRDQSRHTSESSSYTKKSDSPDAAAMKKTKETALRESLMAILYIKPELRELAESNAGTYTPAPDEIAAESSYLAILADRDIEDRSDAALTRECERAARELRLYHKKRHAEDLESRMRDAERTGDAELIRKLTSEFQKLS